MRREQRGPLRTQIALPISTPPVSPPDLALNGLALHPSATCFSAQRGAGADSTKKREQPPGTSFSRKRIHEKEQAKSAAEVIQKSEAECCNASHGIGTLLDAADHSVARERSTKESQNRLEYQYGQMEQGTKDADSRADAL